MLLTLAVLGMALQVTEAATSGPNPPKGVHLSYMDDTTIAKVTWHTASSATSRVEWGPSPGPPYPNSAAGSDYTSPLGSLLHVATLTGLTPGATYYYRVGDSAMASWVNGAAFRAAPPKGSSTPFSFVASGKFGNSATTVATANAMGAANPDVSVLLGDLYYADTTPEVRGVWEKFQAFGEKSLVMTAVGNHDYAEPALTEHCAFVNQPGNERTYAFTYGNTFFLSIDWGVYLNDTLDGADGTGAACGGSRGDDAIRSWVDARLAEANTDPNVWWKIAFHHFPCYLTDYDKTRSLCVDGTGNPDHVEDIYVARGVDIVVSGHAHTYGRTYPVKFNEKVQGGSVYDNPRAPIYTNLGTGGPARTAACRTEPYIAVCRGPDVINGYGRFNISQAEIAFTYVENTKGVIDSFLLRKPLDYAVSVTPGALTMFRNETRQASVDVIGTSNSPVALTAPGCPAATTCTFAPASGTAPYSSTLTISTGPDAPEGTWPITVTGTNATTSRTAPLSLTVSQQVTRTFTRGDGGAYSETDDAYIYNGSGDQNFGGGTQFFVDGSDCIAPATICRGLIKFPSFIGPNAGQVPPGATVVDASLELTVTNAGTTQDAHQVTEAWTETGAKWNGFATPGWPANKGVAFTFVPSPTGRLKLNVTAIVANWVNGEVNQGILFASTHWNGVDYDSSEGVGRPTLKVTYRLGGPQPQPQPFDFSVAVSPASGTVQPGQSATTTATVSLLSGTPKAVDLRCEDLPANTTCAFTPASGNPTFTSSLLVQTSSSTPTGTYLIRVIGKNGTLERTATFTLNVNVVNTFTFTLTFRKGDGGLYSETDDTYIYNGSVNQNYGGEVKLLVDGSGCIAANTICRSLIKFPAFLGPNNGQVPLGANVIDASLELTVTNTGLTQDAHQITEAWTETGGTWNSFATPGWPANKGNAFTFAPTALGRLKLNVTPIVSNWAKGDVNQGILFTSAHYNGVDYDSSEGAVRPTLTVTYQPPGPQPFDFSVAVSPVSASVRPGQSATTTATVSLLSGTPKTVTLRCEDLPANTTCAFSPPAGNPTFTSSLLVQTSSSTPTGTYPIRVIGKNDTLERTATFTLNVVNTFTFTLTFRKGDGGLYSETDDAYIYSGLPNNNYGAEVFLYTDASGCIAQGTICRSLLMFPSFIGPNSGQVPANAQILSATLEFVITDSGGTQYAYQLTESWAEPTVAWNSFATPGLPTTKGAPVSFAAPKGTIVITITAFVQNWVNGDANLGIFIMSPSTNGVDYRSSESAVTPKLTVTYQLA